MTDRLAADWIGAAHRRAAVELDDADLVLPAAGARRPCGPPPWPGRSGRPSSTPTCRRSGRAWLLGSMLSTCWGMRDRQQRRERRVVVPRRGRSCGRPRSRPARSRRARPGGASPAPPPAGGRPARRPGRPLRRRPSAWPTTRSGGTTVTRAAGPSNGIQSPPAGPPRPPSWTSSTRRGRPDVDGSQHGADDRGAAVGLHGRRGTGRQPGLGQRECERGPGSAPASR